MTKQRLGDSMKILAIGNSFSQDATRYLRGIASADGEEWEVVNLYIGGCSLQTHYENALEDKKAYEVQIDGQSTGEVSSIKEALESDKWDIITLQQASTQSGDYEKYQPYLDFLINYVRKYAFTAKLYLHQTWAYPDGGGLLQTYGYSTSFKMFEKVEAAYTQALAETKMDGLIPTGALIRDLSLGGVKNLYRDGLHLSLGVGRYAAAMLWYAVLSGRDIQNISYFDFDEKIDELEIQLVKEKIIRLMK